MDLDRIDRLTDAQLDDLHRLYQGEWWTRGRTAEQTRAVVAGSDLVFGLCERASGGLVAFARALTDGVFKAVVFDVIVAETARGRGLGRELMEFIATHPDLARVAHLELYCRPELVPFYRKWGFVPNAAGCVLLRRSAAGDPGPDSAGFP